MTYYEAYKACNSVEQIKAMAIQDTEVAIFLGNNTDRIKAIEDAMNKAIRESEDE